VRVTITTDLANIKEFDEFKRYAGPAFENIREILNGNISTDNLRCFVSQVTYTAANSDMKFEHRFGKKPVGYFKISGPDVRIFDGAVLPTENEIYLRSSGAGTVTVLVLG